MRCFYHQDTEAVGVCKSCGKGLCRECAADLAKGLACRGRCEAEVQAIIQLVDRGIKNSSTSSLLVQQSRGVRSGAGIFHVIMGVMFVVWGGRDFERFSILVYIGLGFIAYGSYWLFLARRLGKG